MKTLFLCATILFQNVAFASYRYINESGAQFELHLTEDENSKPVSLSVEQIYPPLKQLPAQYDLIEKGRLSGASAFPFGKLKLQKGLRGNSFPLGELTSYSVPASMKQRFEVCNVKKECFIFE